MKFHYGFSFIDYQYLHSYMSLQHSLYFIIDILIMRVIFIVDTGKSYIHVVIILFIHVYVF